MHHRVKALGLAVAAAALLLVCKPQARASIITYDFSVDVTSGTLSGTTENGSFSYGSSSSIPGGTNSATGLLTALDFTFNGTTYNATTVNTGALVFSNAGALTLFVFGTNCSSGGCSAGNNAYQWLVSPGEGGFAYSVPGAGVAYGNVTFSLATPVPEPTSLALFAPALLGFMLRRKRA